jgi:uncharacterized protein (TIRG00374 family)
VEDTLHSTHAGPPTVAGRLLRASTFALGAGLLAYLLYGFGSAKVWLDLKAIGWRFGVIVALEAVVSAINALAWWRTLPNQTRHGSLARLLLVQLAGSALNESVPAGPVYGEPVKVLLLKDQFPASVTAASLLSSKVAQALARALFVILGMLAASWSLKLEHLPVQSLAIGFTLTAAGVAAFMVLQIRGLSAPARRVSVRVRFLGSWVERIEHGLGRVDEHLQELYRARPSDFVASVMLGIAGLGVGVVQDWFIMGWIGLERDWLSSLTIEAFATLVSFVSFVIPGSLGVQEGGKLLIFAALGLPLSAGLSVGVAFRLNNIVTILEGVAALAWLRPDRVFQTARLGVARE